MIPTSGRPASSSSSSASGIVVTRVSCVALRGVDRLEPEPDARIVGRRGDAPEAVDHEPASLGLVAAAGRRRSGRATQSGS